MKTFFTRLGSLLLCGVVFAMVGCTDFSEDIQAVDQKVDQVASNLSATDVKVENLQQTLNELSARLDADYATKAELKKVNDDLNKVIADQVAGLDAKIGKVGEDLAAAIKGVNAAIAELEAADAANEAAIEAARAEAAAAVATLAAALEAEKAAVAAEIEAINAQIAETNEAIKAVDAKAEENHNTLVALSDYLANLELKVNELKATLDSLSEYLPTVEAKIASNTAKIDELKNTLESLALHLNAKEAEVDAKLNELKNTLASLSVYMEALEASIDARFAEILNTIESLSIYLAKLEAQVALNTESSAAANAKAEELYNTILSLSEYLAEEKAANDAKFQEILNTFESLSIHLAKLEAEHAAGIADNSAKIAELKNELVSLSAHLAETEADYAAKFTEIQNTFLSLSEHLNAEEAANAAKFAEILATFESLSQYLDAEEAENDAKFAELQNTLLSLSEYLPTVEAKVDELKNTLESLANHLNEREPIVDAKLAELQSTLISLSIYLEEADLVNRVSALEGDLKAHKAAFEVFEAATVEQLTNLVARTEELFGQLEALSPEFAAVKSQVAELKNELVALSAHLEEREAGVDAKLNELFATFESLSPVIETMQAQIKENNAALVSLSPVIETMQAQILENFNTLKSLSPEIDKLHAKDAELEAKVAELKNELVSLSEYLPTLEAQIKEVKATVESLGADYEENKDVVDAKLAELHEQLVSMAEQLPEQINAVDAKANELKGQIDALAEQLPGIIADALAPVQADVEALFERVQSLVYVPEYSDHKATIDWAMIADSYVQFAMVDGSKVRSTIVVKTSTLKYLVKANVAEDAAAAAATIAANPSVLDFLVTDVKTTRGAAQSGADLEIVNVKAEGEYVIVTVLPKKFDAKFFESKRQGIYSAALALVDDKGNNLTSEYTNLVAGSPFELSFTMLVPAESEEVDGMPVREAYDGEVITHEIPCNDTETIKTAVQPIAAFVPVDEQAMASRPATQPYFLAEELAAMGYDIKVTKTSKVTTTSNNRLISDYSKLSEKNRYNGWGVEFKWVEKLFVLDKEVPAVFDYNFSVAEGVSFENVGKKASVDYTYTCGDLTKVLTYDIVLSNAKVNVNMEVDVPWTIDLQDSVYDAETKTHFAKNFTIADVQYTTEGGPVSQLKAVLSASNKKTASYIKNDGKWESLAKNPMTTGGYTESGVNVVMYGGKYAWNNSYKYVVTTTNNEEHVDYTTTIIVNLVGRPDKIDVPVTVEYVLDGKKSYFSADVDLLAESWKQVMKYYGYETAAEAHKKWTAIFNKFVKELGAENNTNLPLVNGKTGRASNLNQLAEARLSIVDHNNGRYTILENEPNVITWTGTPWFGIPVNFIVTGSLPQMPYTLVYSEDYVTNGVATVYGQIENGEYNILQSDLAKYFNVDAEKLDGHEFTVDFEVLSPVATDKEYVSVLPETTVNVIERVKETYNWLERDLAVLDWETYKGLEVKVRATLNMNGLKRQSLDLTLVTEDPLKITGTDFTVERKLREDVTVQVFKSLVLTSSVEPKKTNLLQFSNSNGTVYTWEKAIAYAEGVYGAEAELVLGAKGLYHYDNSGKEVLLGKNKYNYDEETGMITVYGDDAKVKNYYADFEIIFKSRICEGEHRVPVRITFTLK